MVTALSDRLNRDPVLADAVHQMLTHVTAVRSASEILESADDLEPERRRRFHAILSTESARLSDVAQALAAFFGKPPAGTRSISVSDESSEERRVGKTCVSTWRTRWSQEH